MIPKVSVIIACSNYLEYLKHTLPFLLKQDMSIDEYEIIVVDYGGTDNTKALVHKINKCDSSGRPVIRYIHTEREFKDIWSRSIPINIGVRNAFGNIIMTFDADVVYPSWFISKMYSAHKTEKCLVYGMIRYSLTQNMLLQIQNGEIRLHDDKSINAIIGKCMVQYPGQPLGMYQSVHKKWFFKLHGMNESFLGWGGEDQEWHHRLSHAGLTIIIDKDLYAVHLWHPENTYYDMKNKQMLDDAMKREYPIIQNKNRAWGMIR